MKYEFTRNEIYQWLKEQNWVCKELEEILLADKPFNITQKDYKKLRKDLSTVEASHSIFANRADKPKEECKHKYDPYTNICDYCHRPKKEKSEVKTKPEKIESTMDSAEQGSLGSHAIYINEAIEKINEIIDYLSTKDKEEK